MKTVAKEVKLVHPRTRIALPEAELRNRAKRTETLGLHPTTETQKPVHKVEAPPIFQPKF
jgi:hypothetical protein